MKRELQQLFVELREKIDPKIEGKHLELDHASAYGGYILVRVDNDNGGHSNFDLSSRVSAKEMIAYIRGFLKGAEKEEAPIKDGILKDDDFKVDNLYGEISNAIRTIGLREVEELIYGKVGDNHDTTRVTAISMFLNSRMFKKEMYEKLKEEVNRR